jgi:hypothetical protein
LCLKLSDSGRIPASFTSICKLSNICQSVFCKFTDLISSLNQFYSNSPCVRCLILFNRCSATHFSSYVYCNVSVCGSARIFIFILYEIIQQKGFSLKPLPRHLQACLRSLYLNNWTKDIVQITFLYVSCHTLAHTKRNLCGGMRNVES